MTEPRLKIAVFVDFDNIEIGVKTTLNQPFDISAILEAIKERGEVVTKVAYGDWKRAGDHGRQLSQHAIRLVQRNVIVGGDSDFITLVEKLKQYDKKVFVVGGRQFTSLVMQKNCHEFIAYENLVSRGRPSPGERRSGPAASTDIARALPLVKRALKVLIDREVTPQLGLLKSTLLQLDSTFSERDYGASTFRDFMEKVAQTGTVTLRSAGRSLLVDLADTNGASATTVEQEPVKVAEGVADAPEATQPAQPAATPEVIQQAVGYARDLFARAPQLPRWPMYVRQVKQYLRSADETFDERRFGFSNIVDFLRACQRDGLLRLERDRQGGLRVFPGAALQRGVPQMDARDASDGHRPDTSSPEALHASPLDAAATDFIESGMEGAEMAGALGESSQSEPRDLETTPRASPPDGEETGADATTPGRGRKRARRTAASPRPTRKAATKRAPGTTSRSRKKAPVQP